MSNTAFLQLCLQVKACEHVHYSGELDQRNYSVGSVRIYVCSIPRKQPEKETRNPKKRPKYKKRFKIGE